MSVTSTGGVAFGMSERSGRGATAGRSVEPYLRAHVESGGSDLHVKVGSPPLVRIDVRGSERDTWRTMWSVSSKVNSGAANLRKNTGRVADAIADPAKTSGLATLVAEGGYYGLQTFDQHLTTLYRDGLVSLDAALAASTNPHDLMVELRRLGLVS